jgi:hypothetical protein
MYQKKKKRNVIIHAFLLILPLKSEEEGNNNASHGMRRKKNKEKCRYRFIFLVETALWEWRNATYVCGGTETDPKKKKSS